MTKEPKKELDIYSSALVYCSVCADKNMLPAEIEERVNSENPTGIESRWHISENKTFTDGNKNPTPCNKYPDTKIHYLLNC